MTLIALTVAVSLCAAPSPAPAAKGKPASNDTMKSLVKDAVAPAPAETADGGAQVERPGPPIDKMIFSPESIKTVVTYYQPQIQACYEETLAAKDKAIEGKLVTSFVITPQGMVKKPMVVKKGTTLNDSRLHDCVIAVISAMAFPKPSDNKDHPIEYPFNLKATH